VSADGRRVHIRTTVTDVQFPWVVFQHQIKSPTDTGDVLGEKVSHGVVWSNPGEGEASTDQVTDDGVAVVEQHDAGASGVTGNRHHRATDSVRVQSQRLLN
jgi:hypothetical protein